MSDKYAEIRAALDAGPTPGPWANHANQIGPISREDDQSDGMLLPIAYIEEYDWPIQRKGNALLIAACHPEAIRALLAERDALREALWVATEHNALHFGESHNTVIQGRAALAQEQGDRDVTD